MNSFKVGDVVVGGPELVVIAGPCMAESQTLCDDVAGLMKEVCRDLGFPYIFKASYDKANRTSAGSVRGLGMDAGLDILRNIAKTHGLPTTTDIHTAEQAAIAAEAVDLLQVPAFLCRQSDILEAAAKTGKPVNVKKGQFLSPRDTKNIVEKLTAFNCNRQMLTERGTTFGYNTLIVDFPGLEIMRSFGVPVCFDATHSAQRPGGAGTQSGGQRETIPAMVRAAVAVGIDALFLEVHPDPSSALSDRETQWKLSEIRNLLEPAAAIRDATSNFAQN